MELKFVVMSSSLCKMLQSLLPTIGSKNTLPILDNFLFKVEEGELFATASDLETTTQVVMSLDNCEGEGSIAIEAKRLTDLLRDLPEQPITFDIDLETLGIDILTENGKFSLVGQEGENFPVTPEIKESYEVSYYDEDNEIKTKKMPVLNIELPAFALFTGISKTLFATANDELRPVMNGIYLDFKQDELVFVATDAHKLVKVRRLDIKSETEMSFILPKKPANILKKLLASNTNSLQLSFDDKNAKFEFDNFTILCRLTEGMYPKYESVIPINNDNKAVIIKNELLNTLKRIDSFSNQNSNLIRLKLTKDLITVSAQDIDFAVSAMEKLNCQHDGEDLEIGFKSTFLMELISNLNSLDVVFDFSDPSRAVLISQYQADDYDTSILELCMPMMINV